MSFKDFTTEQLKRQLQLKRVKSPLLTNWINSTIEIPTAIRAQLEQLRDRLDAYSAFYNEEELKFYLVTPLLSLVDYETKAYRPFLERTLQGEVDGIKMRGVVDFIIASGEFEPVAPYFFIHEYKREKGTADDVIAQLLSAMLVAQTANDNGKPIYGCYLIGKLWHFVVLQGREYSISSGHVASNDDIFEIYAVLVQMKQIIETELLK